MEEGRLKENKSEANKFSKSTLHTGILFPHISLSPSHPKTSSFM
jgi:hypothetical protein